MTNYKISVIIPIYKVEKYLNECIDSVISQTYKNLEIILVDDGSPDNCGKICDEYAQKDNRIKVIHKPNGGLVSAWKAGVEISTGEYIGFVDGDDYVKPEMYEKLLEAIIINDADIAETDYISDGIKTDKNRDKTFVFDNVNKAEFLNEYFNFWESEKNIHPVRWDKLFDSRLIKDNLKYCNSGLTLGEDFNITLCAVADSKKIVLIPEKLYFYRNNRESMTRKYDSHLWENSLLLFKTIKDICSIKNINPDLFYNYFNYIILLNLINESKSDLPLKLLYKKIKLIKKGNLWESAFDNVKLCQSGKKIFWIRLLYKLNLLFLLACFMKILKK
jgi:glycosyltransferase involved in cell wall biosynthesis